MDDREKLKHLAEHWKEHNEEHAKTYRGWAQKMKLAGDERAYTLLNDIHVKTNELNKYFEDLKKVLS